MFWGYGYMVLYFFISGVISFLGTLPFGPINLSVVDTTLTSGTRAALMLSVAASLVEILMVFIAIWCSMAFTDLLSFSDWTKWVAVLVLIGLGLFFWLKPNKAEDIKREASSISTLRENSHAFFKGLLLALLNPQAVPFWFFIFASLDSAKLVDLRIYEDMDLLCFFLIGASIGKFFALWLFVALSKLVEKRISFFSQYINKGIGGILIMVGIIQLIRLLI